LALKENTACHTRTWQCWWDLWGTQRNFLDKCHCINYVRRVSLYFII